MLNNKDNVYVNVSMTNSLGDLQTSLEQSRAIYSTTNRNPIVNKASEYYCSILGLEIPLNTIPVMIMPIRAPPLNVTPDWSPCVFGFFYSGTRTSAPIIYEPQNAYPVPTVTENSSDPYYWIYSYQAFLKMANQALTNSWNLAGLAAAYPAVTPPYFMLNAESGLISLIVNTLMLSTGVNPPILYMNSSSYSYFGNFQTLYYGINRPDGRDYDFIFPNVYTPFSIANYYKFEQSASTLGQWSSLKRIVVTSNTIPILYEWSLNTGTDTNSPILIDFVPKIGDKGQDRQVAQYDPQSQYKLIDMTSDAAIQKLDFQIYWETKTGAVFPLILGEFQNVYMKVAFLKKTLYEKK
jgi:hypothetical protein